MDQRALNHVRIAEHVFAAEFVALRRERLAAGHRLDESLLVGCTHDALSVARGAIQGLRGLEDLEPEHKETQS